MSLDVIQIESIFDEAFSSIESVSGQDSIWFGYGDEEELDRILLVKKKRKYPLLWYLMPNQMEHENGYSNGVCRFLIATNTKLDWFNDQRFDNVYKTVLFPYMINFFKAIRASSKIMMNQGNKYKTTNIPNYTKENKQVRKTDKTKQITAAVDYWDVIFIDVDLEVKNKSNCLN